MVCLRQGAGCLLKAGLLESPDVERNDLMGRFAQHMPRLLPLMFMPVVLRRASVFGPRHFPNPAHTELTRTSEAYVLQKQGFPPLLPCEDWTAPSAAVAFAMQEQRQAQTPTRWPFHQLSMMCHAQVRQCLLLTVAIPSQARQVQSNGERLSDESKSHDRGLLFLARQATNSLSAVVIGFGNRGKNQRKVKEQENFRTGQAGLQALPGKSFTDVEARATWAVLPQEDVRTVLEVAKADVIEVRNTMKAGQSECRHGIQPAVIHFFAFGQRTAHEALVSFDWPGFFAFA